MSEDNNQKLPKPKNDADGREFGCPCGKTYLSYPALYTHVRTKHNGKAPGDLMKPKNQKTRGRPRTIIVNTPIDNSDCIFDIKQQVERAIMNSNVNYKQSFQTCSNGNTCRHMASKFLGELDNLDEDGLKIISCFLNELKQFINTKYGKNYWEENSPRQIIDIVNEFYLSHEQNKEKFPIDKNTFINLTYLLFRWMYLNDWTEHKMIKKPVN